MTNKKQINILGIESSCDETAAAVVTNGSRIRSSVVASQEDIHREWGGVVPELASRAHLENIYPVIKKAVDDANIDLHDIDAIAIANQPGLVVSLIIGVTAAKTLALTLDKPLISINHVHAHLQAAILAEENVELPAAALIVSGGHTNLYDCESPLDLRLLGSTIDDAAGEAFDKVASILGLGYPGGPVIDKVAKKGNPTAVRFPRSMMGKDSLDFSFSGLKTAVLYHCQGQDMKGTSQVDKMSEQEIADIAASFQAAVVEVLTRKTELAAQQIKARTVLVGGGVGANSALRESLTRSCEKSGRNLLIAPMKLCTDNAVMIASLAYHKYKAGLFADLTLEPKART
ncbi:t(6)A37 threonylcarbamoyladenosine biosynthesis protein [Anaerohalosphaera lusitana]|uniref:tRNA N6-adenosine threonylcarbamoyltransferase n=1 Tax=Anaerohalosphaera lusitana TaxID=1936003 RepID=A0A1U9NQZ5_9BACT|nr:tRNA (adenosine(37)-N6)-threonylcarbamoyltransferase complex transferase subunit TsaD [Anaerohalosphaera lusitana]AQT70164.1 t(6)A37 threonylcarbamoyladenosine biosynthesis protein [Anaerohalosphaera lusitana]